MDNDFEIGAEIRIFNNSFMNALNKAGFQTVKDFSKTCGIGYSRLCNFKQLRSIPNAKEKEILKKFLGKLVDNMFPSEELLKLMKDKPRTVKLSTTAEKFLAGYQATETLKLESGSNPEHALFRSHITETLKEILSELSPRDQKILTMRYGLDGKEPMSLSDVAHEFWVTSERIRQIEAKALSRLRRNEKTKELHQYLTDTNFTI